eukprot:SAG25_NODE_2732_length_1418_cov_2.280516_1_plen_337_part_00
MLETHQGEATDSSRVSNRRLSRPRYSALPSHYYEYPLPAPRPRRQVMSALSAGGEPPPTPRADEAGHPQVAVKAPEEDDYTLRPTTANCPCFRGQACTCCSKTALAASTARCAAGNQARATAHTHGCSRPAPTLALSPSQASTPPAHLSPVTHNESTCGTVYFAGTRRRTRCAARSTRRGPQCPSARSASGGRRRCRGCPYCPPAKPRKGSGRHRPTDAGCAGAVTRCRRQAEGAPSTGAGAGASLATRTHPAWPIGRCAPPDIGISRHVFQRGLCQAHFGVAGLTGRSQRRLVQVPDVQDQVLRGGAAGVVEGEVPLHSLGWDGDFSDGHRPGRP